MESVEQDKREVGEPTFHTNRGDEETRLRAMILYISQKCAETPDFGINLLGRLLCLADGAAFASRGEPVTGVAYQHSPMGPAPVRLQAVCGDLIRGRELAIEERPRLSRTLRRPVALRSPDLSCFSADDIAIVDAVIDAVTGRVAADEDLISHELNAGWRLTNSGELIPYEALMLSMRDLSVQEQRMVREHMSAEPEGSTG